MWTATTAYTVGQFVRPTAPAFTAQHVFRVTTAGTSGAAEPTWPAVNAGTVTNGSAVFTNVTGQSTYGWSAAAGTLCTMTQITNSRSAAGDRLFLSSDHSESNNAATNWTFNAATHAFGLVQIISVNRAGSTPPVAADIQNGASIATSGGNMILEAYCNLFWQGITITSSVDLRFNSSATKSHYLKNCSLVLSGSSTLPRIGNSAAVKLILDNTTAQFGNASQAIGPISNGPLELLWMNTASAIQGATIPTLLFNDGTSTGPLSVTCRGVDLSAITGTLCGVTTGYGIKGLFDSCKIASGATRLSTPVGASTAPDEVELVNCFDGTNVLNERYTYAGAVTTDRSTILSGGAQDDIGAYSLKLVSSSRADKSVLPLDCFWLDVENTAIGSSKTATVEVISSASLNNDDISLLLEYMGTLGSSVASFAGSLPSVLATGTALTTSSATWTGPAFTTWNPLDLTGLTLSNSNLTATTTNTTTGVRGITGFNAGKFYFEATMTVYAGGSTLVGLATTSAILFGGGSTVGQAAMIKNPGVAGAIHINGVYSGSNLGARSPGDIIGVACDLTAGLIWFRVAPSGNWNGSGTANPATGVGGISLGALAGSTLFPIFAAALIGETATANFGASAFSGAVPSGFTVGWSGTPTSKQKLQVTFTPQRAGRVRGLVRLGKVSTTVWVNPQITIT